MTTSPNAYYLRQSLDRDENKLAIARQRQDVLKLCERLGWDNPAEYCDNNISATKGRRKDYERLCADIADGVVKRVAVWEMDRLHRQPGELEDFMKLVAKHGVELANVAGHVDLSTPEGQLQARTRGNVAALEVAIKSRRQKRANLQRAEAGKPWMQRTFGYDGNRIVPEEAAAIRKAAHAVLNGATLYSIAQEWNRKHLRTLKGYRGRAARSAGCCCDRLSPGSRSTTAKYSKASPRRGSRSSTATHGRRCANTCRTPKGSPGAPWAASTY